MEKSGDGLRERVSAAAKDKELEAKFKMLAIRHGALRKWRIGELTNFEALRRELNGVKEAVLCDHDNLIANIRKEVEGLGGVFHLAEDGQKAREIICKIAADADAKIIVKSKSMTSEEVELTPALERNGIEVLETDLGEYIIQLAKERPSHIVIPAIHKTKEEVAQLFVDKLGMEPTDDPRKMTQKAREVLREKFLSADVGITGANAIVAENGTVVLIENEGNIRLTTTLPRVHVALAGIEKIVPTMADLPVLLKLLPRSATGQKMSGYLSMIRGPRRDDERDGPREFHMVLLDNGRSKMRRDPVLREALKCVRCGACLSACPVYQHVGGHAYGSVYPGPIGAMITRALSGPDESWQLPFMSSLCGACTEVCPAGIPIHDILIELRRRWSDKSSVLESMAFRTWSEFWKRPSGYRLTTGAVMAAGKMIAKNDAIKSLPWPASAWTYDRDFPAPPPRSFHESWRYRVPASTGGTITPPGSKIESKTSRPIEKIKKIEIPRPGDPEKYANEVKFMQAVVSTAGNAGEAREQLKKILSEFNGQGMVRWDHPDLELLGLEESAKDQGIDIAPLDQSSEQLKESAANAAVGVTAADFALAETGTLVLLTGPGRERCISLLPPVHVAVIRTDRILMDIEDLIPALAENAPEDFRGLTLVSSPSMTGDIEMIPVLGVHGPGRLFILLWKEG